VAPKDHQVDLEGQVADVDSEGTRRPAGYLLPELMPLHAPERRYCFWSHYKQYVVGHARDGSPRPAK